MSFISQKNDIKLIKNGDSFLKSNIHLINESSSFILLHSYIFTDDEITEPLLKSLEEACDRGVKVFFLIDAFGSMSFSEDRFKKLISAGIKASYYKPLFEIHNIGRRLHQKVLIVDNKKAIIGGINYSKLYNCPTNAQPWLDYACLVEGEVVNHLYRKVIKIYKKNFKDSVSFFNSQKKVMSTSPSNTLIRVIENNWLRNKQEIYYSYLKGIKVAKNEIIILATYFIPGKKLLKHLKDASKRGVKVKLIFGKFSDHPLASKASDYFYQWYLDQGIQIYEWDQSIIHGKIALIDDKWVNIGSYNHNYISRFGNLELNLEVINHNFGKEVATELLNVLSASESISQTNIHHTIGNRTLIFLVYTLTNLIRIFSIAVLFGRRGSEEQPDKLA